MQLNLTHGTFLFLITVIISTNLSQNGEVQGASVALEAANAKELAIAGKVRYISIWDSSVGANFHKPFLVFLKYFLFSDKAPASWEIWFWDPWGNWVWYEFTLAFASRGQAFKAKEAEAKRELSIKSKGSCRGQVKSSRRC